MAVTKRADLIIPEILTEAIQGEFAGMRALAGSPAAVISPTLPAHSPAGGQIQGGDSITIPYFGTIGEFEDLASDEGGAGAVPALTPVKIAQTSEVALVQHSGKAFEITEWAQMAAMWADPYAEAARQMRTGLERRADKALIDVALTSTLAVDVYNATTPVLLNWETIVNAGQLWGDEQADIALLAIHSKVYGDLLQERDNTGRPFLVDSMKDGDIPRYRGIPIRVSDRLTASVDTPPKYTSLILKRSALAFWFTGRPEIQTDKDILADSRLAAIHVYWAAHRYSRLPGTTKTGVVKVTHN